MTFEIIRAGLHETFFFMQTCPTGEVITLSFLLLFPVLERKKKVIIFKWLTAPGGVPFQGGPLAIVTLLNTLRNNRPDER
jgi:hypothetical protein